ncbi:hypothetical protein V1477_004636, partial [Vespula maculifrons]
TEVHTQLLTCKAKRIYLRERGDETKSVRGAYVLILINNSTTRAPFVFASLAFKGVHSSRIVSIFLFSNNVSVTSVRNITNRKKHFLRFGNPCIIVAHMQILRNIVFGTNLAEQSPCFFSPTPTRTALLGDPTTPWDAIS